MRASRNSDRPGAGEQTASPESAGDQCRSERTSEKRDGVQDALHPSAPVKKETEAPSVPAFSYLMRWVGTAALLAPLIWNGVAAGVHILQGRVWNMDTSGTLAMTTCICAAWGLLLIAVEPPLNRALEKWEERRRANETEEDRAIEEFLNQRDSRKNGHTDKS